MQRDAKRTANPADPTIADIERRIAQSISSAAQQEWEEEVQSFCHNNNSGKYWSTLRRLSGKRISPPPNQPISFHQRYQTGPGNIADAFNKQFTSVVPHAQDPDTRRLMRDIHQLHPLDRDYPPFPPACVSEAIKKSSNSIAHGPDGLSMPLLKHLGPLGLQFLATLFTLSLRRAELPAVWKRSTIVPIRKPGKPADQGTSYRPISLLSPAVKVLERLILPDLAAALPLAASQHGFRPLRSCTSALLPLANLVAEGFNQERPPDRTIAVAIDISKAFDSVDHGQLLAELNTSPLHHNLIRWLASYLRGRQSACTYRGALSPCRRVNTGVPQGSVISPILFNYFVRDFPQTARLQTSYADDFTTADSSNDINDMERTLNRHLTDVDEWARRKRLAISAAKSHITLFTPDKRHQSHLAPLITYHNAPIPLDRAPTILGVTFDTHFTFTPHITAAAERADKRISVMKALAGTSWGHQKETQLVTYKALVRPIIDNASPVWYPNSCQSSLDTLQRAQNKALRIATGSHKMSPIQHLHSETHMLTVPDHLHLLSCQYLASCLRDQHPCHHTVTRPPGPRNKKQTLQSRCLPQVEPYLTADGILHPDDYKLTLTGLHTDAVKTAIENLGPSGLLGITPPDINDTERRLPRQTRCVLSQLRSGHCSRLSDYMYQIGRSADDACPVCGVSPHTVDHLFACRPHPTDLTLRDLWDKPVEVAAFLQTTPTFAFLPPVPPPPPQPPPPPDPPPAM
jgi:hypothetical protein